MNTLQELARYRLSYEKTGSLKYTGHLDMHRLWERSLRRAGFHLAYSQGYHPQPRIQQACALPLGFSSLCELVDFWLEESSPVEVIQSALNSAVPGGIRILAVDNVDLKEPPLQARVVSTEYLIRIEEGFDALVLDKDVKDLLAQTSLPRTWKGKVYDLRPLIEDLAFHPKSAMISTRLSAREGATGRPEELLAALGVPIHTASIERVRLFLRDI